MEAKATDKPIKDELELGPLNPPSFDLAGGVTTDEESELPGTKRPRKGAGWWGQGQPIRTWRKSVQRDFADGAGLCSPGRWPVAQRKLPDGHAVKRLRKVIRDGFERSLKRLSIEGKRMDPKTFLMHLSAGRVKDQPFDEAILQ